MAGREIFKIGAGSPEILSPDGRDQQAIEAIKRLQEIERSYQGQKEVTIKVGNSPIWLVEVGDLHVGSIATDYDKLFGLRDTILSEPNIGLVLLGDEIEGLKKEYLETNTARTPIDVQVQIDFLRNSFLEPLAKEKKILAMVSGYWGHTAWIQDATTVNPWIALVKGTGIPILLQGGILRIMFSNGYVHSKQIFHYPPRISDFDPVFGLRNVAYKESEGADRLQGYSKGHCHVAMVAKENYPDASITPYYISSGTLKGSNSDLPLDRFGIKLGKPPTDPIGQGVEILPRRVGKTYERNYPVISFEHGQVINNAMKLLDRAEQQHLTDELIGKILKRAPKPRIKCIEERSDTARAPYNEMPRHPKKDNGEPAITKKDLAPQFDTLFFDIRSELPITVHMIANARLGASYEGYGPLKNFLSNYVVDNPYGLTVFLRNMIDADMATEVSRDTALDKYIKIMKSNGDQTLAFMLDENLRKNAWKREKKGGGKTSPGVAVATKISRATGARIIHDLSRIKLAVGPDSGVENKPVYTGVYADKLLRYGSYSRPTYGLRRIYDLHQAVKPGYIVGGHMPYSGIAVFYDRGNPETKYPVLIGTGWWAAYVDSIGQGNVSPGAVPGQAIVLMPGRSAKDYMAFPTSNPDETDYIPKGLTLLTGLKLAGINPNRILR